MAEIIKRKNGYAVRITLKDDFGRKKRVYVNQEFRTRAEAEIYAERYKGKYEGTRIKDHNINLEVFLNKWLIYYHDRIKRSTAVSYAGIIRNHLVPYMGHLKLRQINSSYLIAFYEELKKTLSPKTISNVKRCFSLAMDTAVEWGYIDYNPVLSVKTPRIPKKRKEVFSSIEVDAILNDLKDHESYIVFYVLATTGARAGEIAKMKIKDIDLRNKCYYIVSEEGADSSGGVKSDAGERTVTMLPGTEGTVFEYLKNKAVFSQYAFTWSNGKPFDVDFLTNKFRKTLIKLGIIDKSESRGRSLHTLRHTHATELLSSGVNPKIVQERLGHSSITVTMDTYSHVIPTLQRDALQNIKFLGHFDK